METKLSEQVRQLEQANKDLKERNLDLSRQIESLQREVQNIYESRRYPPRVANIIVEFENGHRCYANISARP